MCLNCSQKSSSFSAASSLFLVERIILLVEPQTCSYSSFAHQRTMSEIIFVSNLPGYINVTMIWREKQTKVKPQTLPCLTALVLLSSGSSVQEAVNLCAGSPGEWKDKTAGCARVKQARASFLRICVVALKGIVLIESVL